MFRLTLPLSIAAAASGGGGAAGRLHSWKRRARSRGIKEGYDRHSDMRRPVNQARAKAAAQAETEQRVMQDLQLAEDFDAQQGSRRSSTASRRRRGLSASLGDAAAAPGGNMKRGADVAHEVRTMTDAEWEAVPLQDKHHFVKYVSKRLETHPSEVTEMQRRRFYETTLLDPRREDPHRTVRDAYERVKLGLPTHFSLERSLGVPDAVYEQADAALFDPQDASKIENAVVEVKQMFADYVKKKRLGVSTEAERRALAAASQELNLATQKHLSEMFKYAESKLQETMKEERERQLQAVAKVRRAMERAAAKRSSVAASEGQQQPQEQQEQPAAKEGEERGAAPPATSGGAEPSAEPAARRGKKSRSQIARVLRRNYGIDIETADAVCREMQLQEKFLRECEVLARMTACPGGFRHTPADTNLDAYAAQLRDIYSMNPAQLCRVDAVQYVAALEGLPPVDWAAAWYTKSLLLPLESTPEFRALQRAKAEERAALHRRAEDEDDGAAKPLLQANGGGDADKAAPEAKGDQLALPGGAGSVPKTPAHDLEHKVVDLASRMFADDSAGALAASEAAASLHEKRLRYIAHVHMESQIKRMRENARIFEGAEAAPEAEQVRALYQRIQDIRAAAAAGSGSDAAGSTFNVFEQSAEAAQLFAQIQTLVRAYVARRNVESVAEKRAQRVAALAAAVASAKERDVVEQVRRARDERRREQTRRILDIVERDVKQELYWIETFAEADRPAPLPIPQPMSYVSAADVLHWRQDALLTDRNRDKGNPFAKKAPGTIAAQATFLGQPWPVPDRPLLFWGTGAKAVEQALQHAADDAARRRQGEPLAPPYPCAENPWGWRLRADPLDEPEHADAVVEYHGAAARSGNDDDDDDEMADSADPEEYFTGRPSKKSAQRSA